MALNYVIVSIKLRLDVGNDKCIILCDFGDLIVRGVEVIEIVRGVEVIEERGGRSLQAEKSPVWIELGTEFVESLPLYYSFLR